MYLPVPQKARNFLTSLATISFSTRALLHVFTVLCLCACIYKAMIQDFKCTSEFHIITTSLTKYWQGNHGPSSTIWRYVGSVYLTRAHQTTNDLLRLETFQAPIQQRLKFHSNIQKTNTLLMQMLDLTPKNTVLLWKLTVVLLANKFRAFYVNRKFILCSEDQANETSPVCHCISVL
jgi:hypothetical protein